MPAVALATLSRPPQTQRIVAVEIRVAGATVSSSPLNSDFIITIMRFAFQ